MNKAKTYIDKTLDKLSKQFPNALIYYAFSPQEKTHIIDMQSAAIEKLNADAWAEVYGDLVDDFESKFVSDSLLFVRKGSLVRLNATKAQRTIAPKSVVAQPTTIDFSYELMSSAIAGVIASGFIYEFSPAIDYGNNQRIASSESPPLKTEHTYSAQSVPTYVGTDSFCSTR